MTYDQWKATDEAGDDADVRERECTCDGCGVDLCPVHRETIAPVMCRCRSCGAQFANPYSGGVESALCDACLDAKPTDEQLARLRR